MAPSVSRTLRRSTRIPLRARAALREGWALSRNAARRLGLPPPFEPAEFEDLRRVAGTVRPPSSASAAPSPTLLFLSMRGWSTHLLLESTLAHAAELRGARVVFASCGGRLPICDAATIHTAPPMPCLSCREYAREELTISGFAPLLLDDLVDVAAEVRTARGRVRSLTTVRDCAEFSDGALPLGRLVRVSVAWFLARGTLEENAIVLQTYRRFLTSGQVLHKAFRELLKRTNPDRVVMLNGTFFAERIMGELAAEQKIEMTSYERGFSRDSLVVAAGRPAADLMVPEDAWLKARQTPLTSMQAGALDRILEERRAGVGVQDDFTSRRAQTEEGIRQELGLQPGRRVLCLFSNILWDSAVQGQDVAFSSMAEWVVETISGAAERPAIDLLIRIHPAEVQIADHKTVEGLGDLITEKVGKLPANVRVIPAESSINSYLLMDMASIGLVYTSTVGLEMAAMGVSVVVAANTHYRDRGFTHDVSSAPDYWRTIDSLVNEDRRADRDARKELGRRYAALFFLGFMQPFDLVYEESRHHPRLAYRDVSELAPGRHPSLDLVMEGVIHGRPVVRPTPGA